MTYLATKAALTCNARMELLESVADMGNYIEGISGVRSLHKEGGEVTTLTDENRDGAPKGADLLVRHRGESDGYIDVVKVWFDNRGGYVHHERSRTNGYANGAAPMTRAEALEVADNTIIQIRDLMAKREGEVAHRSRPQASSPSWY